MSIPEHSESPLQKESRLFSEGTSRFLNALLNKVFDLSPRAASIRLTWLILLFFFTGFVLSLINYPLGLWLQRIQDIFLYIFNSAYRQTYAGDPFFPFLLFAWQVFIDPRNFHFLPLMLASFFISLQYAAIYLADIFELEEISIARNHVMEVALSGSDDTIRISKGAVSEESQKSPNFLIGGPGRVIVDLDSAALFEKPDGTPHVIGPTAGEPGGKATIAGFERFREAIDLRDQHIYLRDQDDRSPSVKGRSRDGIPVTATDVRLIFSVYRTVDKSPEESKAAIKPRGRERVMPQKKVRDPDPYPFSRKAIENIVYKAASQVTPEQSNPSTYKFSWINNMIGLVRGELGGFMSQRKLTAYLASTSQPERDRAQQQEDAYLDEARRVLPPTENLPERKKVPPVPEFMPRYMVTDLFREFTDKFTNNARDRGVELRWIGVGTWKTTIENVFSKHLEAWKLSRENEAVGSTGAMDSFKLETSLNWSMGMIQDVPLATYEEAIGVTRNTHTVMRTVLGDYRKQLIQARDTWTNKGETVPQHVEDAIRHLDDVLFHFAGRDNPTTDGFESSESVDVNADPTEEETPGPAAIAYEVLLRMVEGDVSKANELIEFERSQFPDDPPYVLIERAIERFARDRQP